MSFSHQSTRETRNPKLDTTPLSLVLDFRFAFRDHGALEFVPLSNEIANSPRGNMKPRIIGLGVVLLFVSAGVCAAQTAHMNTWKLNEAKSHFSKGASKNMIVVYETAGEEIKVTVDGVDGDGAFTHNEWIGKFDGKDYAVTGDPTADTRAYRLLNSHTLALINKK